MRTKNSGAAALNVLVSTLLYNNRQMILPHTAALAPPASGGNITDISLLSPDAQDRLFSSELALPEGLTS